LSTGPVSPLGRGREFDLIRRILTENLPGGGVAGGTAAGEDPATGTGAGRALDADGGPRVTVGPGDDCAVLDNGIVLSSDMSVEDVHFRRAWLEPEEIGYRAATAALSDLAAMAASPVGVLASIAAPAGEAAEEETAAVMRGVAAAAHQVGAALLGGDISTSGAALVIDVTVVGHSPLPVLRGGARPGDALYVTGTLGGAGAAVRAWTHGTEPTAAARAAFARPHARIAEALWLAARAPLHALIDLSDGIAGDARHIAAASGVRLTIETACIPLHPSLNLTPEAAFALAVSGGEDYELLLAADRDAIEAISAAFSEEFGIGITRIGTVEAGSADVWLRSADGAVAPLELTGYRHFEARP
jgi:thiamine-monophosphate kinase